MTQLAKYLPHNAQEFENDMRALIVSHMGLGQGNPTQWVVSAVCEAFQRGFGEGFRAGGMQRVARPREAEQDPSADHPAYKVVLPAGEQAGFDRDRERLSSDLPIAERVAPEADPRRIAEQRRKQISYDITDVEPKS